jgi:hypothetical protein
MSGPYLTILVLAVGLLLVTVELLRRRQLREKYAAIWILVALGLLVGASIPRLIPGLARAAGFELPSNLVFVAGGVLLTVLSMQFSAEIGSLEDETQRLAEEVALLRDRLDRLDGADGPDGARNLKGAEGTDGADSEGRP